MTNKMIDFGGNRGLGYAECDISHPTAAGILRSATASGEQAAKEGCGMMMLKSAMAAITIAGLGVLATPALAADNPMKICGAKYREAKTAGSLPPGQTWMQFLAQCRGTLPKSAANEPAAVSGDKPAAPAGTKRPRSAAQTATASRQHECGNQWKADKAAGKIAPGQTWPQYWSACNKRLK
jgi:hypothetical protein